MRGTPRVQRIAPLGRSSMFSCPQKGNNTGNKEPANWRAFTCLSEFVVFSDDVNDYDDYHIPSSPEPDSSSP